MNRLNDRSSTRHGTRRDIEPAPWRLTPSCRLAATLATCVLVSACASTVRQPVAEADRDTRGVYDGRWVAHVAKPASTQKIEQWIFTCPGEAYDLPIVVSGGQLQLGKDETWVNAGGEFRLEVPSDRLIKESAGSGDSITNGQVTYILQGSLGGRAPSGYITAGVRQFGNNGCSSRVTYERLDGTRT